MLNSVENYLSFATLIVLNEEIKMAQLCVWLVTALIAFRIDWNGEYGIPLLMLLAFSVLYFVPTIGNTDEY